MKKRMKKTNCREKARILLSIIKQNAAYSYLSTLFGRVVAQICGDDLTSDTFTMNIPV